MNLMNFDMTSRKSRNLQILWNISYEHFLDDFWDKEALNMMSLWWITVSSVYTKREGKDFSCLPPTCQRKRAAHKKPLKHLFTSLWKLNSFQIISPRIAARSSEDSPPLGNHRSQGIESGACPHETEHFLPKTLSLHVIIHREEKTNPWIALKIFLFFEFNTG